jgi:hypothetical protein
MAGAAGARADQASVAVTSGRTTASLPSGFTGLGLEYNTVPEWVGRGTVDPVLVRLIRNLTPTGRPVIRIGGQSTDRVWWPVRGMHQPLGVTYGLSPRWTAAGRALAGATGGRLLLGINLEANRTRISQTEADQLVRGVGSRSIDALEIGNEPDLYPLVPWYKLVNGRPAPWYDPAGSSVFSRPLSWGPAQYVQELTRVLRVLPPGPIAGPETNIAPWLAAVSGLRSRRTPLRVLTSHAYGLNQCILDPTSPQYPTVPNLLSRSASENLLAGVAPDVGAAHRRGETFRIDEMGSVTCNGRPGVSNTMASALWVLDALFAVARQGVDGVNLHTYPNSDNGLFDLSHARGGWTARIHPLYYGALMFAQAAPAGSALLRVVSAGAGTIRSWATIGPDHRVRVLVINDSLTNATRADIRAPAGYGRLAGSLERLRAPSAYASAGVTLGGRSFGATTASGILAAPVAQTVTPRGGVYAVRLPPASAGLLTLAR